MRSSRARCASRFVGIEYSKWLPPSSATIAAGNGTRGGVSNGDGAPITKAYDNSTKNRHPEEFGRALVLRLVSNEATRNLSDHALIRLQTVNI